MTATPPKPSLVKTSALSKTQSLTTRLNSLLPSVQSQFSPTTVYEAGTVGVGGQLSAPTSVFPAGAGYYGVWTAPDLNNGNNYTVQVECFGGGGGGGGGCAGTTPTGGGGGGGGEYAAEVYYPVKPGTSYVWQVGVPGSAGTANSNANQGATAGGSGGTTIFDLAGTGVAGGVVAQGGLGGDIGNTGLGGNGGSGSSNTVEYGGGAGATNLPGSGGGGSGGTGGTDNPVTLHSGGLLSAAPVAWYIMNDASSNGQVNDASGQNNPASLSGSGSNNIKFGIAGAPSQVPAYSAGPYSQTGSPNATSAGTAVQFPLRSLTSPDGNILTPGIFFQNNQVTISAWLACDTSGTWGNNSNGSRACVASNTTGYISGHAAGGALFLKQNGTPSNPNWTLNWYCGNDSSSTVISTPLPANPANTYYVVGTFSSGSMVLYVNGTSVATGSASFSSVSPGNYAMTIGESPTQNADWFFGYMSNVWIANGVLSSSGVTQAYSGAGGGGGTGGGAGGGASGGPAAAGGAGSPGSGSTGGAGGTPATQPANDIGLNTPASVGIAGANNASGNSGLTGAPGAGGGGAGASSAPPAIVTVTVPFTTAASYCGTDAAGGAAGSVYNPVIQGTTGRLFTGGQSADAASGSKNSLLILPPNLAASLQVSNYTVTRVTLTVYNANPTAAQGALMQVGWSTDTFLPITYTAGDIAGSAGVVEIPAGAFSATADLTESQLGLFLQNAGATALVLGPGSTPTFAAYNADTAADFYTAVYGPGATDNAGNSLAPFLTVTYAQSTTVQQGSPGGAGAILVTYLNQAETLVGSWNSSDGLNAQGGQLTETTVVLGSTITDAGRFGLTQSDLEGLLTQIRADARKEIGEQVRHQLSKRLGGGITGAPGTVLGYTSGTTNVTQSTPGSYTFTVPAGVTSVSVACWGAGAGAIGGSTSQGQGGGGGGAYAANPAYAVVPGDVIHYTVGAGGTGRGDGNSTASPGGATVWDSTTVDGIGVTANGGSSYNSSFNYGPGGTTTGAPVNFSGGNGGPLSFNQQPGSGGGGSGGASGAGGGGSSGGTHGSAGSGGGATGGAGSTNGSGTTGSAPGGGGGGASRGSAFTGGSGGAGKISITYVSTNALNTSIATASGSDTAGNTYPEGVMTNALQVNGTTTSTNTTVSGTTQTGTLTVTANASVAGNHTVTGNVAVGGTITGASGGTLESSSGIHAAGTVQGDGGLTTSSSMSSGSVSTGAIGASSLSASGQVLAGGASSGATMAVAGTAHITGTATIDGGVNSSGASIVANQVLINASGGLDLEVGGSGHIGGSLEVDGNMNIVGSLNGTNIPQGTIGNPTTAVASLQSCCNGLISRLQAVGIIS